MCRCVGLSRKYAGLLSGTKKGVVEELKIGSCECYSIIYDSVIHLLYTVKYFIWLDSFIGIDVILIQEPPSVKLVQIRQ